MAVPPPPLWMYGNGYPMASRKSGFNSMSRRHSAVARLLASTQPDTYDDVGDPMRRERPWVEAASLAIRALQSVASGLFSVLGSGRFRFLLDCFLAPQLMVDAGVASGLGLFRLDCFQASSNEVDAGVASGLGLGTAASGLVVALGSGRLRFRVDCFLAPRLAVACIRLASGGLEPGAPWRPCMPFGRRPRLLSGGVTWK